MRLSAAVFASLVAVCVAQEAAPEVVDVPDSTTAEPPTPEVERAKVTFTTIKAPFLEQFTTGLSDTKWKPSEASKKDASTENETEEHWRYRGVWEVEEPTVHPGLLGDLGLVVKTPAAHHAISSAFSKPIDPSGKTLVVQYETKLQDGLECGGAYLKLLTDSKQGIKYKEFDDHTPYTIMFGPDKCGSTNKVHVIIRHKNPKTGKIEEKHLENPPLAQIQKTTTLYTLVIRPDNTFEVLVNDKSEKSGSLLTDFSPPFNPPKEIDDPEDKKPGDWVDDAKIEDPDASKPEDWDEDAPAVIDDDAAEKPEGWLDDEAETIRDESATKPEYWDDEEDGEWSAPEIPNPKCADAGCGTWTRPTKPNPAYKGKWKAPQIDNPAYKGVWAPRKVANPDFYEDLHPAKLNKISGIGFELWTMQANILFDNIYVGHSEADAKTFAAETFHKKLEIEKADVKANDPDPLGEGMDGEGGLLNQLQRQRAKLTKYLGEFVASPVETVKAQPVTTAVVFGLLVAVWLVLSLVSSLVKALTRSSGSSAAIAEGKKKAGKTVEALKKKAGEAAEQVEKTAKDVAKDASEVLDKAVSSAKSALSGEGSEDSSVRKRKD